MSVRLIEILDQRGMYSEELSQVINEYTDLISSDEFKRVDTKAIHDFVHLPNAYYADNLLIGFTDLKRLIYYNGGENGTEVVLKVGDLWIYETDRDYPVID